MRNPATERTRRGNRREVIIERAAELFYERGFRGTGIDEIGNAAGVSGPAIYRHFKSKEEIMLAIVEQTADHIAAVTESTRSDDAGPQGQLQQHVRTQAGMAVEWAHFGVIMTGDFWDKLPAPDRSRVLRKVRMIREEWVHVVSEARPDLSDAAIRLRLKGIYALLQGMAAPSRMGDVPADELTDLISRMLLAAIYA